MSEKNKIISLINESIEIKKLLLENVSTLELIEKVTNKCISSINSGHKIIFAGNGGSYADAQHLSAEFIGKFILDRKPMPAVLLGANNSSVSAISNDYDFEYCYEREFKAIFSSGDILLVFSTSGNSKNILRLVETANILKCETFGFSGETGGNLNKICNCIKVQSNITARIQECHILIGHIICEIVEEKIFGKKND